MHIPVRINDHTEPIITIAELVENVILICYFWGRGQMYGILESTNRLTLEPSKHNKVCAHEEEPKGFWISFTASQRSLIHLSE